MYTDAVAKDEAASGSRTQTTSRSRPAADRYDDDDDDRRYEGEGIVGDDDDY
jgi:hypothetical protein